MVRTLTDLATLEAVESRKIIKESKRKTLEATITPELAGQFGKAYILGRYASPELVASAAVAGISEVDDLYKNLQTQLLKQGLVPEQVIDKNKPGKSALSQFATAQAGDVVTVTDPRTGKPLQITIGTPAPTAAFVAEGQEPVGLRVRSAAELQAAEERRKALEERVPVVNLDKESYSLRGMQGPGIFREGIGPQDVIATPFKILGVPFHFAGAGISYMSPNFLEPVAKAARGFTKTATILPLAAAEFPKNFVRQTLRDAWVAGQMDANPWERFTYALNPQRITSNLEIAAVNTTFGQTISDIASGEGADFGGGWFAQGETGQRARDDMGARIGTYAENLARAGKPVYVSPQDAWLNQNVEPGRLAGDMLVDAKLIERDGEVYQLVSDLFETGLDIGLDIGFYWDPTNALIKRYGSMSQKVATEYVAARKAGDLAETLRIEAENGLDAAVTRKLADTDRMNAVARSTFQRQEGTVYSGDRSYITGKTVESFLDVDDPNFVPNTGNLFGEGLYVTDQAFVASTNGYNVPGALSWDGITPEQIRAVEGIFPEGSFFGSTGLNKGDAAVWKFDMSNLNIIDGEATFGPGDAAFDALQNAYQRFFDTTEGVRGSIKNEDLFALEADLFTFTPQWFRFTTYNLDDFQANINSTPWAQGLDEAIGTFDEVVRAQERVVAAFPQFADLLKSRYGFDDGMVRAILPKIAQGFVEGIGRLGIGRNLDPDVPFLENFDYARSIFDPSRMRVDRNGLRRAMVAQIENVFSAYTNFDVLPQEQLANLTRLRRDMFSVTREAQVFGEFFAYLAAPLTDNPYVRGLLDVDINDRATRNFLSTRMYFDDFYGSTENLQQSVMQKALVDAGFDGVSYAGGRRIGGAGDHTATVVWKPSKLQHIDLLSGEKFPINRAVSALDDADRFRISAEELQDVKESLKDRRTTFGLIDDAPRTIEPNNLNNMRFSKEGKQLLQRLADENNPVVIWRDWLKRKSPGAAIAIAQAKTPDEVWRAIEAAVYAGDPDHNLRILPYSGWKDWFSNTGFKVKQNVDRYSKQTAMMPDSTYIPFDDAALALERADRVLQVSGVKGADREVVLLKLFDAVEQNTSKAWDDFFEEANEKALTIRMRKAGWDEETIRLFTSYRWKGDDITRFTLEDLADDIPIEWFDEGDGPLRITQLLSRGGFMISPEVLDELVRDLNPVIRGLKKITSGSDTASKAVASTINAERVSARAIESGLRNWAKPAALGAPLPIRYIFRVIPEEMLRVAFSGNFENLGTYVAAIYSGHLNYDVFGDIIMDAEKAAKERAILEDLKFDYDALTREQATADPARLAKIQARINKMEKKHGTIDQIEGRIEQLNKAINDSLPSATRRLSNNVKGHIESTYDQQTIRSHMERSDLQSVVSRKVSNPADITKKEKAMRRSWVTAQASDIADMTLNADYRAVAKALEAGDPASLERVARELLSGDLREVYDEYTKNVFNVKAGWDWETIEGARARVNEIATDIRQRTALDPDILDVISTGTLNGDKVVLDLVDRVYETTPEFTELVAEKLLDNPQAPDLVPYYPNIRTNAKATRNANWMYNTFSLYTKASAAMARNPLWVQAYWKRVTELMPVMDNTEAVSIIGSNVDQLPDYLLDRLNDAAEQASGTLNRKEVTELASLHARDVVDSLLYNGQNNKSYFGYRHQILFMFFDAYREQWATWLKLMKRPANLHKVDMLTRQLKEFREPFTQEDNSIIHNDPTTNKQVVTVPFSRWIYRTFGGDAQLVIPTRNLSLVGSTAPGFSPVISILASGWEPTSKSMANVKSSLFPFATGDVSVDIRDYVIPQFAQYLTEGVAGIGSRFAPQLDTFWALLEKVSGPNVEKIKKASVLPIMRQLAADVDKYSLTPESRAQLLEDADALSDVYAVIRAFSRAFLPAASITQFFQETKQGTVLQGILLDEIRNIENEVMGKGGTLSQAIATVLDRYGTGVWAMLGSGSETNVPGLQPTKEYQNWVFDNKKIIDTYPNAGGYLGPQEGEYNNKVFVQQTLLNWRQVKDPKVALEEGANLLADAWYDYQVSQIPRGQENTTEARQYKASVKSEIQQRFPTWSILGGVADAEVRRRLQMNDVKKMINDGEILRMPQGVALKNYMTLRETAIQQMVAADPSVTVNNWTDVEASASLRQYLFDIGKTIAEQTPEFNPIWTNVLVKEFDRTDLAAAGATQQ
jgi:hypothetical protein